MKIRRVLSEHAVTRSGSLYITQTENRSAFSFDQNKFTSFLLLAHSRLDASSSLLLLSFFSSFLFSHRYLENP